MKQLHDFKEEIHKCSKCGLCQAQCPIYQITGNDCAVSRGQFIMLNGVVKGDLKMSKTINRYLDLCLKCGKCSKFCPSGIDVVDVIVAAKQEYFKKHCLQKLIAFVKKYFVFGFLPRFVGIFRPNIKSKSFEKKVLYFGGCQSKLKTNRSVIKILNNLEVEVICPNYGCCGISLFAMGDLEGLNDSIHSFVNECKKYDIKEVVTNCTSCEKMLKNYIKWANEEDKAFLSDLTVKNIFEYLRGKQLSIKKEEKVTYHIPCSLENRDDVEWILKNTENLKYIQMQDYDKCCGLNGIEKVSEFKILNNVYKAKRDNIIKTGAKTVLTSCLGCEIALKLYSFGRYKTEDLIDFIGKRG